MTERPRVSTEPRSHVTDEELDEAIAIIEGPIEPWWCDLFDRIPYALRAEREETARLHAVRHYGVDDALIEERIAWWERERGDQANDYHDYRALLCLRDYRAVLAGEGADTDKPRG
jgi:hypothetical protein